MGLLLVSLFTVVISQAALVQGFTDADFAKCTMAGKTIKALTLGDYKTVSKMEDCVAECGDDPECEGFTYKVTSKRCFLKPGIAWTIEADADANSLFMCCLEGSCDQEGNGMEVKVEVHDENIESCRLPDTLLLEDKIGDYHQVTQLEDCIDACNDEPLCKGFVYKTISKRCYLKPGLAWEIGSQAASDSFIMCCLTGECDASGNEIEVESHYQADVDCTVGQSGCYLYFDLPDGIEHEDVDASDVKICKVIDGEVTTKCAKAKYAEGLGWRKWFAADRATQYTYSLVYGDYESEFSTVHINEA